MQELNSKVLEWAENKGILNNSRPLKQLTKTFEEVTELFTALVNQDQKEIIDSIGDVNVTLIILRKLSETMTEPGDLANSKLFYMINWIIEITRKICQNKDVSIDIARAQEGLARVAIENGLTLEECTQSAYDVIAKRTGKMIDGVFVKDGPKLDKVDVKPTDKPRIPKVKEDKANG